jgi:TPR repeat protein
MPFEFDYSDERFQAALGLIGLDRNAGLLALRKLAISGNKSAICELAMCLSEETPSTDDAVHWLKRASEFGYAYAAWNLAMIAHERGDPEAVKTWIDRAADLGEEDAVRVQSDGYDVATYLKWLQE